MHIMNGASKPNYEVSEQVAPGIRRVLARNPGAFTYTGTGTYIVGEGAVAVIDPGPDDPDHINALAAAVPGETVSHILVTHTHRDHSPAARALKAATGAPVWGCAPLTLDDSGPPVEAGFDPGYAPDHVMADGETVQGPGWTLEAVATPGHTSNHLCFSFREGQALFSGDHVMGWSTTVIAPPDGDMAAYMASLEKLLGRDEIIYYPTHGAPVENPQRLVRGMLTHRRQREQQILALLGQGTGAIAALVEQMYVGLDPRLKPAAALSVEAHLIDLRNRRAVNQLEQQWTLVASQDLE